METWKKYMPDWEIKEWNEDNLPEHINDFYKQAMENKKWAFASDVARLYALYTEGGIYMDTDVFVYKPLDKFLNHDFFTGFEQAHYPVTATMGAKKGNNTIKEMLDIYEIKQFQLHDNWHEYETNTVILSDILGKYINRDKIEYQENDGIVIYPRETFCYSETVTDEVYTKHLMFGNWVEK